MSPGLPASGMILRRRAHSDLGSGPNLVSHICPGCALLKTRLELSSVQCALLTCRWVLDLFSIVCSRRLRTWQNVNLMLNVLARRAAFREQPAGGSACPKTDARPVGLCHGHSWEYNKPFSGWVSTSVTTRQPRRSPETDPGRCCRMCRTPAPRMGYGHVARYSQTG